MQQPHERSGSNSTTGTARVDSSAFDRAIAAERLASTDTSREPSPVDLITRPAKSRHPPSSLSKFSVNPYLVRQDPATSTLQGIEAVFHAAGPMRNEYGNGEYSSGSNESSNQSSYDSTDTEPIAASAPRLLNRQARPRTSSRDLDLMQSHRMSQAAETGQFAPRTRRAGQSGEWASIANGNEYSVSEAGDYFGQRRISSPSPTNSSPTKGSPSNPFITPKVEALPAAVRRSSLPDVTPFAKFCQTAPPSPDSSRTPHAIVFPTSPLRGDKYGEHATPSDSPSVVPNAVELPAVVPGHETAQTPIQQTKRGSFEHRKSNVIRGHGSGFEILRPGSLNPPMPSEHGPEKRPGPPISLYNSGPRERSSSADSRKKLQKKRRPSEDFHKEIKSVDSHRASVI